MILIIMVLSSLQCAEERCVACCVVAVCVLCCGRVCVHVLQCSVVCYRE